MKKVILVILAVIAMAGCGGKSDNSGMPQETEIKVYCDEAISKIIEVPTAEFDSINYQLKIQLLPTVAHNAMAKLLAGEAQVIILSREYSDKEDSLMKAYNVPPFPREVIAHDALVFYVQAGNNLDTITDKQLKDVFTNPSSNFAKYYPNCGITEIACNSHLSSEYFNLKKMILEGKQIAKELRYFSTVDSVKNYVKTHKNAIGVGYLSQLYHEPDLRAVQVSFIDSTGKYQYPVSVHQANIVRGFYPYRLSHYIFLYDNKVDVASAYLRYICKNGKAQKYFNSIGIVPGFGQIRLVQD